MATSDGPASNGCSRLLSAPAGCQRDEPRYIHGHFEIAMHEGNRPEADRWVAENRRLDQMRPATLGAWLVMSEALLHLEDGDATEAAAVLGELGTVTHEKEESLAAVRLAIAVVGGDRNEAATHVEWLRRKARSTASMATPSARSSTSSASRGFPPRTPG